MKHAPFEIDVSSSRGAPMGRHSDPIELFVGARVQLRKVPFEDSCYDPGGAYWGDPTDLWCAWGFCEIGDPTMVETVHPIVHYLRAPNREAAKAKLPGARFYKVISKAKKATETFFNAYVECALWITNDESAPNGGVPFDTNYGPEDLADEARKAMRDDCDAFYKANAADISRMANESQAGHDFWLTRNRHGAGFWDRGLGALGDRLTKASETFDECNLYLGDDGKIYAT